jgi:hypothetical protein
MDESTTNEEATAEATPDESGQGPGVDPEEPVTTGGQDPDATGWAAQLQRMIDDIGRQAAPVVREVAAKAAELAAVAGEKAGPFAQKAAEKTAELGAAVAARGHEMATELRRADDEEAAGEPAAEAAATAEATVEDAKSAAEEVVDKAQGA